MMKTFVSFFCIFFLLVGKGTSWAQDPLEKQPLQDPLEAQIRKAKYTIDSIVSTQKRMLNKQLASVEDLLEQKKITSSDAKRLKEALEIRSQQQVKEFIYHQAQNLQLQLQKGIAKRASDSLRVSPQKALSSPSYERVLAQVDSLALQEKEDTYRRRYTDRGESFSPYIALSALNLASKEHFGDKRLSPLGSKSFEIGFYSNYRLKKNDNLLHLTYGLSWVYNSYKIRGDFYYDRQGGNTVLTPYSQELTKSKFRNHYLMLPVELEWDFSQSESYRGTSYFSTHQSFRLGVGVFLGVLLDDSQKLNWEASEDSYKLLLRKNLRTNRTSCGLSAHIGYGQSSLYFRYSLSPLFVGNAVGEYPFSVGIRIGR